MGRELESARSGARGEWVESGASTNMPEGGVSYQLSAISYQSDKQEPATARPVNRRLATGTGNWQLTADD
jgi:hypothetical protein